MKRQGVWLFRPFALDKIRQQVEGMEMESRRFYRNAARRNRYRDTPLLRAAFQVVVGGVLVFLTGILIGGAG